MKYFLNLKKSAFFKNILTALTGSVFSQLIPIIAAPILTRLYKPSDYGIIAIYSSITSILFIFVSLQYSQSILITKTKEEEDNVMAVCYIFTILFSLVLAIAVTTLQLFKVSFIIDSKLGYWLFLTPVTTLLYGFNTAKIQLLNKYKLYKGLSVSQILSSITSTVISLIVGFTFGGYQGLLLALLISQLASFISLFHYGKAHFISYKNISFERIKDTLKIYKKFPIFSIPTEFLFSWTEQLPIYYFSYKFNLNVIGYFNYGKKTISLPISLVTSAIGRVFAQNAAEQYNKTGECQTIFIKTFKLLALPSLPFFIILVIYAPDIFHFIFGKDWVIAGEYVQILSPMFYLKSFVSPLSYMYIIKQRQGEDLIIHIVSFLLICFSFFISYLNKYDIFSTIGLFSFSYCFIYIYTLIRSYVFAKKS